MSGVLQLLFDTHGCPATSVDVTALLYRGEEGTAGALGGGISGQAVRFTKATNARWSCTFTLVDTSGTGANRPQVGQAFRLLEDGTLRFSGFIDQIDEGNFEGSTVLLYDCTCSSWASMLDRRVLTKVYQQNDSVGDVIADIIATIAENITTLNVIVSGTLTTPIGLDGPTTVSQAFDTIRDMADAEWWVDENKDLHFVPVNAGPALGFSVTLTNGEYQAGSMKITRTTKDKRNVQYVTSKELGQPPPSVISSNPAPAAQSYVLLTDTFVTATVLDFFVLTSQPIQLDPANPIQPTVTVNGVAQTVKQYFSNAFGSNAWYWTPNGIGVQQGQQIAPAPGSTVVITYQAFAGGGGTIAPSAGGGSNAPNVAPVKDWVVVSDAADIAAMATIDGSTGKWENVTSVSGISDPAVAGALAQGLLDRSKTIPDVITFDTWRSDYVIGSKLTVNLTPLHNVNGTYTVQQIQAQEQPATKGPISGQTFLYSVTVSNEQNIGDYVKWMEGLVRSISAGSSGGGGGAQASIQPSQPGLQVIREIPSGTMNGVNKVFTLTFSPQPPWAVWLMLNGVLQHELGSIPDYSLSGSTITFTAAPKSDDEMTCLYFIANPGLAPQRVNVTVYSTGAFQQDGDADAHWVRDAQGTPAIVINTADLPPAWVAAPAGSRWVGQGSTGTAPAGTYTYKLLFQFPNTTGKIVGFVTGDDDFTLKLNGVTILSGGFSSWTSLHAFSTTGPFIAGTNTLEVDADEDGSGGHGILVVITQATSP